MTGERKPKDIGALAAAWWRDLNPGDDKRRDRGALARLKRAGDLAELLQEPAFGALVRRVGPANPYELAQLGRVAMVLAHVRGNDPARSVARALGPASEKDTPVMSPARFRRLLQSREPEDVARRMIRAVRMLDNRANVADLARSLWYWGSDNTRRNWAFHYLAAQPPGDADAPEAAA